MKVTDVHPISIPIPYASGSMNVYFWERPVPTLLDVPPDGGGYYLHLETALKKLGYRLSRDIERIVVTHPHFDHFGIAGLIASQSGAEIWAFKGAAGYLESFPEGAREDFRYYASLLEDAGVPGTGMAYLEEFFQVFLQSASKVKVSRRLEEGDEIELGSTAYRVVHVPGHTPWCFMVYDADRQIAFTGDFLIKDITSNALHQRPAEYPNGYRSLKSYIESLKKARDLGLAEAYSGHGEAISDVPQRIEEILASIESRRNLIISILAERGHCAPFQIVKALFQNLPDWQILLGVSEVIGHLEVLEEKMMVQRIPGQPITFSLCGR
jgi:glyoxylase-like metal-dependent hydrolase (beta-lactamase superfamily II)